MRRQRRSWVTVLALSGIGLVAIAVIAYGGDRGEPKLDVAAQEQRLIPVPRPRIEPVATPTATPSPAPKRPAQRSRTKQEPGPVRIVIPAIGVSAPIIPLGLNSDGTMQTPATFSEAGWFRPGPEPGEFGPSVIVGHVDSYRGPGVFFRLRALQRGDRFRVELVTGRKLHFVVTSSRDVVKVRFPTKLVFRHTRRPTLRLVTCGGRFDASTGHYVDNHIVFAWLLGAQ